MEPNADREALLVPVGTRLVHIGPPKTGTTSLQAAMWSARDAMRRQGVLYAGKGRHSGPAVRALVGSASPLSDNGATPPIALWDDLARSIRRATEPRVVLSSEFLAQADTTVIRQLARDVGPDRVHVVVTLRPLARMLASRWQQNIQNGAIVSYDSWLRSMFEMPEGQPETARWYRQRHDLLIERWADVVGVDRVTVVVVDDRDHTWLLRTFAALTGLAEDTLQLQADLSNRSLTLPEVEALRAFNESFRAGGHGRRLYTRLMRLGLAGHLKLDPPPPGEPRIETPQWALDRAGEIARMVVPNIAASGVTIVGDLDRLTEVPRSGLEGDQPPDPAIPPRIAASMAVGILIGGGLARQGDRATATDDVDADDPRSVEQFERIPSRRVRQVIFGRMRVAGQVRWAAWMHRISAARNRR